MLIFLLLTINLRLFCGNIKTSLKYAYEDLLIFFSLYHKLQISTVSLDLYSIAPCYPLKINAHFLKTMFEKLRFTIMVLKYFVFNYALTCI